MNQNRVFFVSALMLLIPNGIALAQPAPRSEPSRFEAGVLVSKLGINDAHGLTDLIPRREVGGGGRFTYNLKSYLAVEAELNYFPSDFHRYTTNFTGGPMLEGLAGVKAGLRKKMFGVFGKFRPGFESSGEAAVPRFLNGDGPDRQNPFGFERIRSTQFAMDVGAVFEFYPSPRTILRFDGATQSFAIQVSSSHSFRKVSRFLRQSIRTHRNSAWASISFLVRKWLIEGMQSKTERQAGWGATVAVTLFF